jgi:hypothetical protein
MDDSVYYSAQKGLFCIISNLILQTSSYNVNLFVELQAINAFLSPREKLECLLNCCRIITCKCY